MQFITFENNNAYEGAAMYFLQISNSIFKNITLSKNSAIFQGSGFRVSGINNTIFENIKI